MDCFRHSSLPSFTDQPAMNFQSFTAFSGDNFFSPQVSSEFSEDVIGNNLRINSATSSHHRQAQADNVIVAKAEDEVCETKKRKAGDVSRNSSSTTSGKNEASSRGKKVKMSGKEGEELGKDVVHVRARRGQATDSHSLAERVRRGKINEKLRCLQDIVPGCYKTMGMAVMLDEIINYVQSLQNQVEFLSMKLSAASSFYDFNSDTYAIEMLQRAKVEEAQEVERLMREGYGGGSSCINSTTTTIWPF